MIKKTFLVSLLSFSIFIVFGSILVYGQAPIDGIPVPGGGNSGGGNPGSPSIKVELDNPFKGGKSLFVLLKTIINDILLPIGGVLAVLAFIYTGFLYVMAQGNPTKISNAHQALLVTSIGTAILLGSWVLANVICRTIGQLGGPICPA
jgi:hypothetical protein